MTDLSHFAETLTALNPEQRAAVTLPRESALILAGAGSGKTRVLTTRIAYLVHSGQARAHSILAVTFTNKAAKEMLARLGAILPINPRHLWVGTFHGLCHRLLRMHYREAGLPQLFQILDSQDQLAAVKRLLKGRGEGESQLTPQQVRGFICDSKEAGLRPQEVEAFDPYARKMVELYAAYEAQCEREGATDFAELLLRSYELLRDHEAVRRHYQERFTHILVDEFQDTNRLQYLWLKLLAGTQDGRPRNAVFAVGDDDQSIYAFRGARVGNMADFERDFGVQKIIRLEQNYRSQGNILDAANALISQNQARLGKNLWTDAGQGEALRLFAAPNDFEEAAFVIDEIRALKRADMALADMALLYRSNAQSRVFEHALFTAGLPYRVYGGLRFFERQEVKQALAYLRLVAAPDDDGAFLRAVNFPPRGVGHRTLEQLQDAALGAGVSLWRAARDGAVGGRGGGCLAGFLGLVEELQGHRDLSLAEQVALMLDRSGLESHYREAKEPERLENLAELVSAAEAFSLEWESVARPVDALAEGPAELAAEDLDPLASFLAHAALESGERQAGDGHDALQLMTVHAAKGLEFQAVFITGLEEGLFPHEQSLNERASLEEERRLMYVAITRARRRLYLSYAQVRQLHGQTRYGIASRFLAEIPPGLVKRIGAAVSAGGSVGFGVAAGVTAGVRTGAAVSGGGWRIGQSVAHPKFGVGVIVNAEGRGADQRLQINFGGQGVKWLAPEYAKLTVL